MKPTRRLHDMGQSLWLDTITRGLLTSGTLARYIEELDLTGLTSNPTIFDLAIQEGDYDEEIRSLAQAGRSGEALFYEIALEDLARAADLFRPAHEASAGIDGWVSLELSPLLAEDAKGSIAAAARLHAKAQRPNLFIKIPGTPAGTRAIEESIFAGVPINVTLLFSREQYLASAEAYMRGIERRIAAGRDPRVASVASLFVSRWDVAVKDKVPAELRNRLGIAIAMRTYKAYREKTLHALADHGKAESAMPADGGDAEEVIAQFRHAGIDDDALAATLQREGDATFTKSWNDLMERIASKSAVQRRAGGSR